MGKLTVNDLAFDEALMGSFVLQAATHLCAGIDAKQRIGSQYKGENRRNQLLLCIVGI